MADGDRIPKVLVVDDEPNIRELVEVALKFHGCAVAVSASGKDALHQVGAYDPDLMILDVMLPDMDGFEVWRARRRRPGERRRHAHGGRPGAGRGALGGAPRRDPGGAVADRVPAARVPDAQPGPDADQAAAAGERVGLGIRRPVPGGGDVRELPAA